jgi:hypothetical protein
MASTTIKSTYSLDVETIRELDAIARRWKVSKSEALRRAIHAAARVKGPVGADVQALQALDTLQSSLGLTPDGCAKWEAAVRRERRASSKR